MSTPCARARFEQTARAVSRLRAIQLYIMYDGEDWKPESNGRTPGTSDPTAQRAIYNVDVLADTLDLLRAEEKELTDFIGESLVIIQAVKDGFGTIYGNLLEWRYLDRMTWAQIHELHGIKRTTGHNLVDIACDWVDSIGMTHLLEGNYEL